MYFKVISEEKAVEITHELFAYFNKFYSGSQNIIYTSKDPESARDNVGWYNHSDNMHRVHINIPNILCARLFVEKGVMDIDAFYAFLALCVGHEFRHFGQGTCIYDGKSIDGYGQSDVLNAELMMFIRYFFDAYYLLNKSYVKYEIDAEKFAVLQAIEFFKQNYPEFNVETSLVSAVNFYADLQERGIIGATLPRGCRSTDEIIFKLSQRLEENLRITDLRETLFVYNPRFYSTHFEFGLDEENVITPQLLRDYRALNDGTKQDLLVVKRILSLLEHPVEAMEDFPNLKREYLRKNI